jgi:hypothetical protein
LLGVVFYLTLWYTPIERAQRFGFVFLAGPLSGLLGGIVSYVVEEKWGNVADIAAWRWLFVFEVIPPSLTPIY